MDGQPTETSAPLSPQQPDPSSAPMDISRTTIVVLVLVTLMISVIGTWTVLNEISTVKVTTPTQSASNGKLALNILPPGGVENDAAATTGRVLLEIRG